MSAPPRRSDAWPWAVVILLGAIHFSLATRLTEPVQLHTPRDGVSTGHMVGSSRSVLSDHLRQMAGDYFHGGVQESAAAGITDLFQDLYADINPHLHEHPVGKKVEEILPWLWLSVQLDAHNVQPALEAAYFLSSSHINRPDLASEVLATAQRSNPDNPFIIIERARLDLRAGHTERAKSRLQAAFRRLPEDPRTMNDDAQQAVAQAATLAGLLHEADREREPAIAAFKTALALFPDRAMLAERVRRIAAGHLSPDEARERIQNMVRWSEQSFDAYRDHGDGHGADGHEACEHEADRHEAACEHEGHDHHHGHEH